MKKVFITFGNDTVIRNDNYYEALKRICNQAKQLDVFDEIIGYNEKDLKTDTEFWSKHKDFIENNRRGYGFYLWKPYLILKTLKKLNDGDILLYLDAGCELNLHGKKKLLDLFDIVQQKKIIGTKGGSCDIMFTKADLIDYCSMNNHPKLGLPHMAAGVVMLIKCDDTYNLYKECYEIGSNNYNLIDDSPSKITNNPNFREHRHDQSIFNILVKKYDLLNYDMGKTSFEKNEAYITNGNDCPIWTCRNRTGISIANKIK